MNIYLWHFIKKKQRKLKLFFVNNKLQGLDGSSEKKKEVLIKFLCFIYNSNGLVCGGKNPGLQILTYRDHGICTYSLHARVVIIQVMFIITRAYEEETYKDIAVNTCTRTFCNWKKQIFRLDVFFLRDTEKCSSIP